MTRHRNVRQVLDERNVNLAMWNPAMVQLRSLKNLRIVERVVKYYFLTFKTNFNLPLGKRYIGYIFTEFNSKRYKMTYE